MISRDSILKNRDITLPTQVNSQNYPDAAGGMKPERGHNNRGSEAIKEGLEDLFRRASGSR